MGIYFILGSNPILGEGNGTPLQTLAWKIPWMEEPGRLQSMGSLRVGHDWATSLSLFTFMHCRRKWQPTPVFLPGESQGRGSLVGCQTSMGSHRVGHDWSDLAAAAIQYYFVSFSAQNFSATIIGCGFFFCIRIHRSCFNGQGRKKHYGRARPLFQCGKRGLVSFKSFFHPTAWVEVLKPFLWLPNSCPT